MQEKTSVLLTARQVQRMFDVDRSTVYRMAAHGTLPAVKIGRQWRFPAEEIERLVDHGVPEPLRPGNHPNLPVDVADAVAAVAAHLLGVTIVVTDMNGRPITGAANACERLSAGAADGDFLSRCLAEWRHLADEVDFEPRFRLGPLGFECARAFVRRGTELIAMVVAGGVAPTDDASADLHHLDADRRRSVLATLPRIAAVLSNAAAGHPSAAQTLDVRRLLLPATPLPAREDARNLMEVTQ